ncbi:unnamed protein product [Vicia faba]|uniref:Uncharacterized protein n=1 Tax=Vicia faba TaxID=3906 RepID=A0AAV0YVU8_VICFA|nr:unnamed protein product [Vicia faba]
MKISQLSRQVDALPSSNGVFIGNTIYNPKNETCKALESWYGRNNNLEKEEIMEEVEVDNEQEVNENTSDSSFRGVINDQLIDRNSPSRRTKKHVLNDHSPELPHYIKSHYTIRKKKPKEENEVGNFYPVRRKRNKLNMVVDMKGDTENSLILRRPFLAIGKALIDMESSELMLQFNNEHVTFNAYELT